MSDHPVLLDGGALNLGEPLRALLAHITQFEPLRVELDLLGRRAGLTHGKQTLSLRSAWDTRSGLKGWIGFAVAIKRLKSGDKLYQASMSNHWTGHTFGYGETVYGPSWTKPWKDAPDQPRGTFTDVIAMLDRAQENYDRGCTNPRCSGRDHK